jgi:hypothetical protein
LQTLSIVGAEFERVSIAASVGAVVLSALKSLDSAASARPVSLLPPNRPGLFAWAAGPRLALECGGASSSDDSLSVIDTRPTKFRGRISGGRRIPIMTPDGKP